MNNMREYAIVNNYTVTEIKNLEDDQYIELSKINQCVIDIEDISPKPQINWVLNGNKLEFPNNESDREALEIQLAVKKTLFGKKLAFDAINKIGARNKILNKNGVQVGTLLTQLLPIKMLLETGALGTARYSCTQLKIVYTEYFDIFDYVINEINNFEESSGL